MLPLRVLLNGLVDYAGVFPPVQLPMRGAVQHYAGYRRGDWGWALGRLIVPIARLDEFEQALLDMADENWRDGPWRLTGLAGKALDVDVRRIIEFNKRHADSATRPSRFEAIDAKTLSVEDVLRASELASDSFEVYVEVPVANDPDVWIGAAAEAGVRVKVRTGGVTPDLIPSSADLARFLGECARARVAFKATAGLHHPVRSERPLTYEVRGPSGVMHGFLNVFFGAAFVWGAGMGLTDAIGILDDENPDHFVFTPDGIAWRHYRLDNDAFAGVRRAFATSFGSCSFDEPIGDLKTLGLLRV